MSRFLIATLIGLAAGLVIMRLSRRPHAPESPDEAGRSEPQESP